MPIYEFEGRVPCIAASAYVAPSAQVIGDVDIGERCYVGHGAILRGDYGAIRIGAGTAVEEGVIVHARPGDATEIGRRVTLGHGAMVHNATIRDGAVIGMRATVSDFSVVGAGAIVGEMTLVRQRQRIPARRVAVGVPAVVVGTVSGRHRAMTVWAKELYVDLARRYPAGLRRLDGARDGPLLLHPIGVIRTPFVAPEGTPVQGCYAPESEGTVEVLPQYAAGLRDLDGFSHVTLLYVFDRCRGYELEVVPYLDRRKRGLFATRAPRRPNSIGLTTVALRRVEGAVLHVAGVDMLDGTPLLDVKPFAPRLDHRDGAVAGWMEARFVRERCGRSKPPRADGRFHRVHRGALRRPSD
jgi:tRNA-Thr(GGU) m(6)t(6)A37 methyltransferase TsaA